MSIQVLTPTSDIDNTGNCTSGGTSFWQVFADESTYPYVLFNVTATTPASCTVGMSDLVLATDQRIIAVRARARYFFGSDLTAKIQNGTGGSLTSAHWTDLISFDYSRVQYGDWLPTDWTGGEWSQADVNGIRLHLEDAGTVRSDNIVEAYAAYVDVDVRSKPITTVTAPVGAANTRRPTVTWVFDPRNGETQSHRQVKIYTAAEYGAGGFNPSTTPVTTTSVDDTSDFNQWQVAAELPDGSYRAYVRAAKSFNGVDWWSDWSFVEFTLHDTPLTPTGVTPLNTSVVTTDVPLLVASTTSSALGSRTIVEWQLATDAAFTTNLRTITEDTSQLRLAGSHSLAVPSTQRIWQGVTWFVRAKAIDESGDSSPWSTANSFTASHAPTTANQHPTGAVTLDYGGAGLVNFSWDFSDPSSVDSQSAYELIVERNADGTLIWDSGQVNTSAKGASHNIASGDKDAVLRWKIRVWDSDSVVGPYSGYQLFHVSTLPSVVITAPADSSSVDNPQPTFQWTVGDSGGRSPARFQVVVTDTGSSVVVYDSGWVTSSATSFAIPNPLLVVTHNYSVQVNVQDTSGLIGTDTNLFNAAWTAPTAPSQTIDASTYGTLGYVNVSWTDAARDGTFYDYEVWRRVTGTSSWTVLYTTVASAPTFTFHDWFALSGTQYDYTVVQKAVRFGAQVPSALTITAVTPTSEDYWLLHPTTESKSFRLRHVASDEFDDEFEEATIDLIGRGRHKEYGTEFGYTGTLTFTLYDELDSTARVQKQAMEALKRERVELFMRNPFGDIWQVAAGTLHVSRISGVGQREFCTITFPYEQVA